jgi:hypothetical protein
MAELVRAKEPFQFCTRLHLSELTGLRAVTLQQLLTLIKQVPGSSIYHHTHRYLQQHHFFSPEPPNDFAYWVTNILREEELGEKLASIDTVEYPTIRALREKIAQTIEEHLKGKVHTRFIFAHAGDEFHFIKSISFILPTRYTVYDLAGFLDALQKVTIDSIYFHIFESRLRLEKPSNDFSFWIENSLGNKGLAEKISKFDPYTRTLDDLRKTLILMVEKDTRENG